MAQKQYSFDFVLNAVLNGGFSAAFSKAQQEFIRLGTEIKNLQAIQRDVRAWEKQEAAVKNTTAKLDNLKRQYELVDRQISETAGSTAALEREKLKLEQRISNTSAALEKQQSRLKETAERLDEAGVSTDSLNGKEEELKKKIEELTEEQKKAAEGAAEFGGSGVDAIEAVGGALAAARIAEKVREIANNYRECVDVSKEFGQGMSNVEAIADASRQEMRALTAEAKELGATTVYTARQSAAGMEYMAMAGWDAQEMLSGMKGMTTLAAAAGEDLAQVSDIVTDNLSAFNMKASGTAHFADVLAAAAANSNTNIAIMGETFKNSSSVAGALRYSIEDVAVMVGLMANNAVKGSRAGTAMRNIFNGLLGGVTLTSAAFGELEYSAVNSDGSMRGLMETVRDLRGYFDQMTEAERVNNAMAIAGMRGYNGLLAILNATDEDFQSLYDSINNCSGAAERMAKVKLDNLNGDVILMNSAMEALQTTIGEQFTPELRKLTQLKTELLNGMNQFIQENPAVTKGIMAGTGAFMAMGTTIVGVNAAITAFKALNLATLFAGPAAPLLALAGGVAGLAALVVGLNEAFRDGGPAVREMTEAARELNGVMRETSAAYEETAATTEAQANVAEHYVERLGELEAAQGANAAESREYQETLALLLQVMPGLSDCISQTTDEYGRSTYALNVSKDALLEHVEALKQEAMAQALMEKRKELYAAYADVLLEAERASLKKADAEDRKATAEENHAAANKRLNEILEIGIGNDQALLQEYWQLQDAMINYTAETQTAQEEIDNLNEALERDEDAAESARAELDLLDRTEGNLCGTTKELAEGEQTVQGVLGGTMERVKELAQSYTEAYQAAAESFSGQFGLFDEAKADADATVAAAQKALDSQLAYWQRYAGNIAALREISAQDLGVTRENYDKLMEYVRNGTPEAAGLAADMVKAVNDGNTQALTDLANTLGEISESQDQAAKDVADWTAGLTEQMDQFVQNVKEEIEALDLSDEAAESGRATVQSYVDEAERMLPQVRSAYARIAQAANSAMGYQMVYVPSSGTYVPQRGYASGTDNAAPGWAWVGEAGPELMRMRGGEQILPNRASREVAESYRAYERYTEAQGVQPARLPLEVTGTVRGSAGGLRDLHFHIESGAQPETVDAWREYASRGELKAVVLEVLEDAEADMNRRAMV